MHASQRLCDVVIRMYECALHIPLHLLELGVLLHLETRKLKERVSEAGSLLV